MHTLDRQRDNSYYDVPYYPPASNRYNDNSSSGFSRGEAVAGAAVSVLVLVVAQRGIRPNNALKHELQCSPSGDIVKASTFEDWSSSVMFKTFSKNGCCSSNFCK